MSTRGIAPLYYYYTRVDIKSRRNWFDRKEAPAAVTNDTPTWCAHVIKSIRTGHKTAYNVDTVVCGEKEDGICRKFFKISVNL